MQRLIARAVIFAASGAFAGAALVVLAYSWHPALTFEMDRDLPRRIASGLYPVERSGDLTFAWTSRRADIRLPGVNRRGEWGCELRLRGARGNPSDQPTADIAVDGVSAASLEATNEFQDVSIRLPPRPAAEGAVISITSSSTLVPGASDSRELGVQIDRVRCHPTQGFLSLPPLSTVRDAALAAAEFGAAFALTGVAVPIAASATGLIAAGQSIPLSTGPAPYVGFSTDMLWFAAWIALVMFALVKSLELWTRVHPWPSPAAAPLWLPPSGGRNSSLPDAARVVVMFSAVALYLKLLGLLHPSKLLVDAVFHAHRFEWVMSGRYFFTQPMPGGVSFPYAIALYVFAAPWSVFTRDHVTLLRVVVCAAETVAAALLYPVIVKAWNDRVAGVLAVVFLSLVPLVYGLVGNANLTNAFGEAVALATIATASMIPSRDLWAAGLLFLLAALAFLSHVSTFAILGVTLVALCILYRWRGGPVLHRTAWIIGTVTVVAALLAVLLYYIHFTDVYRTALRVRADEAVSQVQAGTRSAASAETPAGRSLAGRVVDAVGFALTMIGWPMWILAAAGMWQLWREASRDRATLAILAWSTACAAFFGVAVMRVDAPFQRYAAEFFGRVLLATCPAVVMLAARGISWGWREGMLTRIASAILLFSCAVLGVQSWLNWFA